MPRTSNYRSANAVADYFLLKIDPGAGDSITNLKLQKLCYFAQGWSLALLGRSLFDDPIEAWAHGPVIPKLYSRFRRYKWHDVNPSALKTNPLDKLNDDERTLLDEVWKRYSRFSGRELEAFTHRPGPWRTVYGSRDLGDKCTEEIPIELIATHFRAERTKRVRHGKKPQAA